MEWTHTKVMVKDVRKVNNFYILDINKKDITSPLFVSTQIFEARLNSYYLNNSRFTRDEVMGVQWNMVISQGGFYKINKNGDEEKTEKDPDRFYISFLDIAGPLGNHLPTQPHKKNN